jgi:hypothetical protein
MTLQIKPYQHLIAALYGDPNLLKFEFCSEQAEHLATICEQLITTASLTGFKDGAKAKDVIYRRFGIGKPSETLKSIGLSYNISTERVRQIEAKFLRQMKHPSRRFALQVFLAGFELVKQPPVRITYYTDTFRERVRAGESLSEEEISITMIDDLDLSVRSIGSLRTDNISTLAQLKQRSKQQLMRLQGFGRRTLAEVESVIQEFGVVLKEE